MKTILFCGALAAIAIAGCMGTTTPSRSQTLTLDRCTVNIYGCGTETNEVPRLELATQAMSIENSGSESNSASASQTTDVKPDTTLTLTTTKGAKAAEAVKAAAAATSDCPGGDCSDCSR